MKVFVFFLTVLLLVIVDCVDVEVYTNNRVTELTLGAVPERYDIYIENDRVKIYYITPDTMFDVSQYYVLRKLTQGDTMQQARASIPGVSD